MQQGFQGLTSMGQQVAQFAPLYERQSVDAKGYAIQSRPTTGKYALESKVNQQQQQQNQQQLNNFYSNPNMNQFMNPNFNTYSAFYNNPSLGG
jgi:hypothetical protein